MRSLFLLTLIIILILSCNEKTKPIEECFSGYKKALLENNGQDAIKWVDKHTFDYYDRMLQFSITADSLQIENMGLLDKLMILTMRHRIPIEEILKMDANSFFIYAVDNGMISKNSVMNTELGQIDIDENFAKGQLIVEGQNTPVSFHFYKENNDWKIDLTSVFIIVTAALKKVISDNGQTENEFIEQTFEILTGRRMSTEIWKPLNKK